MYAESRTDCEAARPRFEAEYQAKYPKVVESLVANWQRLVTFFDFPASTGSICAPPMSSSRRLPPCGCASGRPGARAREPKAA